MKKTDNTSQNLDDRLTDFADRVLAGKVQQLDQNVEDELQDLEQMVLRMQQAFPPLSLEEADIKRMQLNLNARVRREQQEAKQPFWKIWFGGWQSQRTRQQTRLAFAGVMTLIVLILAIPYLNSVNQNTTGTSGLSSPIIIGMIVSAFVVGLILWAIRRK